MNSRYHLPGGSKICCFPPSRHFGIPAAGKIALHCPPHPSIRIVAGKIAPLCPQRHYFLFFCSRISIGHHDAWVGADICGVRVLFLPLVPVFQGGLTAPAGQERGGWVDRVKRGKRAKRGGREGEEEDGMMMMIRRRMEKEDGEGGWRRKSNAGKDAEREGF